jgi:hypothetical protein
MRGFLEGYFILGVIIQIIILCWGGPLFPGFIFFVVLVTISETCNVVDRYNKRKIEKKNFKEVQKILKDRRNSNNEQ